MLQILLAYFLWHGHVHESDQNHERDSKFDQTEGSKIRIKTQFRIQSKQTLNFFFVAHFYFTL